ncbi:MAG: recombinase family protein [Deltaproteobacteria bacterium]|nr:recombinase family protein [Deltaproteobacteria bacterium]
MGQTVIYARKSTESEDRQVLSISSQVRELKSFAVREKLHVSQVFTESMSAKSPGRPVFNELFKQIHKGKFDSILCWKLDRLARNPVDGGAVIWAIEENNLKRIHTPQRTFDNSGNDKFWMQLEFGMAKKYVDDLSDNVKRGLRAKLEQGWMPGLPPLGYLNEKANKTVIRDPERFPLVRRMWDLMLTGNYSPKRILDIATNEWGLRTRKLKRIGGGPIAFSTVYKILTNPFYYGAISYNNELHEGAHEPMITKSEFDRVQYLLGLCNRPRPQQRVFAYTGLIRCGECGASITAEHKVNRQGHEYDYYRCTKKKRSISCSQPYIEARKLDAQIAVFLDSITITKRMSDWCKDVLKTLEQEEKAKDALSVRSLRKRYDSCMREVHELLNLKLRGLIDDSEYLRKKSELQEERFRLKELLEDRDGRFSEIIRLGEEVFDFASLARQRFENASLEDKRSILRYVGSNLVLKDRILLIEPQKPLFYIQRALKVSVARKAMLELEKKGLDNTQSAALNDGLCALLGVVEDVRTFLLSNKTLHNVVALPHRFVSSSTA